MIPQSIKNFIHELSRLEYVPIEDIPFDVFEPIANGISDADSIETYGVKIDKMLLDFFEKSEALSYQELNDLSGSIKKAILKLNNFRKVEDYLNFVSDFEANSRDMPESERFQKKLKISACRLCWDVYNKQFETADQALQWTKRLLTKIDPNKDREFDPNLLFRINEKFEYKRIIQRIINTLHSEGLIKPDFGGSAKNFKLLFTKFNEGFVKPEPIKWYAKYEQLSFFIKSMSDLGFISESMNAKVNGYSKGCTWFVDEEGKPFSECKDKKKQRFRGRAATYKLFYQKLKGSIEAAKE